MGVVAVKGLKEDLWPSELEELFGMKKSERQRWTNDGRLHVARYKSVHYPASRGGWTDIPLYDVKQARRLTPERLDKWREQDAETRRKNAKKSARKLAKLNAKRKRKRAALAKLMEKPIQTAKIICLDTETTGLEAGYNGIVDLAIISEEGETLFHHLIRPSSKTRWTREASNINGIHPADVEEELTMKDYLPLVQTIIDGADMIVAYNADFDLNFLEAEGVNIPKQMKVSDVMLDFAIIYGEWNSYFHDWKWKKLTTCAAAYHYSWEGKAHGALADALATLFCFNKIRELKETPKWGKLIDKRKKEADEATEEDVRNQGWY